MPSRIVVWPLCPRVSKRAAQASSTGPAYLDRSAAESRLTLERAACREGVSNSRLRWTLASEPKPFLRMNLMSFSAKIFHQATLQAIWLEHPLLRRLTASIGSDTLETGKMIRPRPRNGSPNCPGGRVRSVGHLREDR